MVVDSGRSKYFDYMQTQQPIEYIEGKEKAVSIWSRTWLPGLYLEDKKRLLTIGDAVTEGMSYYYEALMGSEWSVHRQTGSISICDELYLLRLRYALTASRKKYDVICFVPTVTGYESPEEFNKALSESISLIKENQPKAKLVLAGITMHNASIVGKNINTNLFGYNKALQVLADENGLTFVDLGAFSQKIIGDYADNGILFTDAGYKKLTFEVVKFIK